MYLSSVPYWSASSSDIPKQFLTSLELPYRISMGNSVPLYSMHKGFNANSPHSMFPPTAYNIAAFGREFRLGTEYCSSMSTGYECTDVSTEVKQKLSQSKVSIDSSTKKVDSSRCTTVQ